MKSRKVVSASTQSAVVQSVLKAITSEVGRRRTNAIISRILAQTGETVLIPPTWYQYQTTKCKEALDALH